MSFKFIPNSYDFSFDRDRVVFDKDLVTYANTVAPLAVQPIVVGIATSTDDNLSDEEVNEQVQRLVNSMCRRIDNIQEDMLNGIVSVNETTGNRPIKFNDPDEIVL